MSEQTRNIETQSGRCPDERKEFRSYVWGVGLALLLTLLPFSLVQWAAMPPFLLLIVIGALALVQMLVHFRFFLHIGLRQKREDLQLIAFSALLLIIMVAGTIWIMDSLATRMTMPGQPRARTSAPVVVRAETRGFEVDSLFNAAVDHHDDRNDLDYGEPRHADALTSLYRKRMVKKDFGPEYRTLSRQESITEIREIA